MIVLYNENFDAGRILRGRCEIKRSEKATLVLTYRPIDLNDFSFFSKLLHPLRSSLTNFSCVDGLSISYMHQLGLISAGSSALR